jgi:hypothetical protein
MVTVTMEFTPMEDNGDFVREEPKKRQQKHAFTADEDLRLTELVTTIGIGVWSEIEKLMPGRSARQCRERWNLYLSPEVSNEPWSAEEDAQLIRLFQTIGPNWTIIASNSPKRTANNIKNKQKHLQRRAESVAVLAAVPPFAGFRSPQPSLNQQKSANL